uniref:ATP-dependent DNA helicase RecG n=1 Tax=Vaginimicrobium propionicum TaxID=1871034 RepID=UPI001E54BA4A|nr:ATP-dependent DNA helicase RecG [Vaginimicrobium propionicum]
MYRLETFQRLDESLLTALGDKTERRLATLGLVNLADLIRFFPRRLLTAAGASDLSSIEAGESVAVVAKPARLQMILTPGSYQKGRRGLKGRLTGVLVDDRSSIGLTFFGREIYLKFWEKELNQGHNGIFVGKVGAYRGALQMTNPQFIMLDENGHPIGRGNQDKIKLAERLQRSTAIGIYPANKHVDTWQVADAAMVATDLLAGIKDPMPKNLRAEYDLPDLYQAISDIHRPKDLASFERGKYRLKFDEALALQVAMATRRLANLSNKAMTIEVRDNGLLSKFDAGLPFELTDGQRQVSDEIFTDLAKPTPMQRLLQGEVGSGKTVVALRAMLACVDAGYQAVLMAPTEVLAAQHYATINELLVSLGVQVALLTGAMPKQEADSVRARIACGQAQIVIGTHALIADRVEFCDVGLVIIDEQHRFGVQQRELLKSKAGLSPHVLVLTATPIPRSIAMVLFGESQISVLRELPVGRQDVQTTVVNTKENPNWVPRIWQRIAEEVAAGRQAFVVCPRISVSDDEGVSDAAPPAAVEDVFATLSAGPLKGLRLGMLHGRLSSDEKQSVMKQMAAGSLDVLVATTVIEVGVDIPNASVMVILDADRFGIAQLHQLRGRIGRGNLPGLCLLTTGVDPKGLSAERLQTVAASRDGFELAEKDLLTRKEGDILGLDQSGRRSSLRLLRVVNDAKLLERARWLAEKLVTDSIEESADWICDMVTSIESQAS